MKGTLRLTLPIHTGESATSFVSRIAVLNGITHARRFGTHMGFRFVRLASGSLPDFDRAVYVTGVDRAALESGTTFIQHRKQHLMNGQLLSRDQVERERLRFCPHCVAEDERLGSGRVELRPWGRTLWHLKIVRSCPVHQCTLVTAETKPPSRLAFDFLSMLDIERPKMIGHLRQTIHLEHSQFDQYFAGRLSGVEQPHDWLNTYPLYAAARLTELVGATIVKGPQFERLGLTDLEWAMAANEGMNVMTGGISAFKEFVRETIVKGFTVVKCEAGGASLLGQLYRWLAWENMNPVYDEVRDAIREEYVDNLPVGPGEPIFGKSSERKWHSVHSLSREYSVNSRTLRKLLLEAELIGSEQAKATDERVLIEANVADEFLRHMKQTIDRKAATRYCNIPYSQWDPIVALGHLKPFLQSGRHIRFVQRFKSDDLDVFLEAIKRHADLALDTTDMVDIPTARRAANSSLAKVLELVMQGGLASIGLDSASHGYLAIRICARELREATRGGDHGALSLREAAKALNTTWIPISGLVQFGLLRTTIAINPVKHNRQTVVETSALQDFRREYVTLFGLMSETGTHHRTLSKQLRERGVRPVVNPKEVGIAVYRRSDL